MAHVFNFSERPVSEHQEEMAPEGETTSKKLSFSDCLMKMHSDSKAGVKSEHSECGQSVEELVELSKKALEALLELHREYATQRMLKGISDSVKVGVRVGRKPKDLPECFKKQVQRWRLGQITGIEAAKICGIPVSTFYAKASAKVEKKPPMLSKEALAVCADWSNGYITKKVAAERIGISEKSFNKIIKTYDLKKNFIPIYFDRYYTIWKRGFMSKKEAANRCGMSMQRFEICVRKIENEYKRKSGEIAN